MDWGLIYTMDHEVVPWMMMVFSMVQLSWSIFLKTQNKKVFGWKLNMNKEKWPCIKKWMWWCFWYMSKKAVLRKKNQVGPYFFFVFSCLHLLFPKEDYFKNDYNNISLLGALVSFYPSTSFAYPSANPLDNVGLKICH